jgi:hypothetical protein
MDAHHDLAEAILLLLRDPHQFSNQLAVPRVARDHADVVARRPLLALVVMDVLRALFLLREFRPARTGGEP